MRETDRFVRFHFPELSIRGALVHLDDSYRALCQGRHYPPAVSRMLGEMASITALMSSFGRAFHAENEEHPVFADHLARALMTDEEYAAVQSDILGGEPMKTAFSV